MLRTLPVITLLWLLVSACANKTIDLGAPELETYYPLQVGRSITYRLDSTVLTAFGADTVVRSYRVTDRVDAEITDGMGRKAFRILRTLSNLAGTQPPVPNATFMTIPVDGDRIEHIDNNMRFIRLRFPIREGFRWKGNSFIETTSFTSPVQYLAGWEYEYQRIGEPFTVNGKTYPNTITVLQADEVFPPGPFDPRVVKSYNYGVEVYAEGIGLIYKNFDHKMWQPAGTGGSQTGYWEDGSYRIILSALEHN